MIPQTLTVKKDGHFENHGVKNDKRRRKPTAFVLQSELSSKLDEKFKIDSTHGDLIQIGRIDAETAVERDIA